MMTIKTGEEKTGTPETSAKNENPTINGFPLCGSLMDMAKVGPGMAGGNNRRTLTDEVLWHAHRGMGFRFSAEMGRSNVDMVWAEIVVAAIAGSGFYGLVALAERAVTFWHPSVRSGRT